MAWLDRPVERVGKPRHQRSKVLSGAPGGPRACVASTPGLQGPCPVMDRSEAGGLGGSRKPHWAPSLGPPGPQGVSGVNKLCVLLGARNRDLQSSSCPLSPRAS